jgi:hypothetical protein
MSSSQLYSQLTNSASITTLNTINQTTSMNPPQTSSSNSSPFNVPPTVASSGSDLKQRNDGTKGSGLNIFNVDFLTRKNRERKEKKSAVAAESNSKPSQSKFSRGKKSKQNASSTSNQYENLG